MSQKKPRWFRHIRRKTVTLQQPVTLQQSVTLQQPKMQNWNLNIAYPVEALRRLLGR